MDGITDNSGWIASLILAIGGATKYVWDYLKKRSDDATKVKLHDEDKYALSKEELTKQYNELLSKFSELEDKFDVTDKRLDRALMAFEIILPLIQKFVEDKPEHKAVIDKALKHLIIENQ